MDTARRTPRTLAIAGVVIALAAGLTGCTNSVGMSAAPSANTAACAAAQVRLPATVDSTYDLRNTNAQSTAAWGDPEAALYHCGVAVPTVSDLPCFTLGSVDWIRDDRGKQIVYTTFGRSPAVQVVVDTSKTGSAVLQDIATAVSTLPEDGHKCLDPSDVQG
ncbi:uncharacterized protein DUF3515 [Curtobacterium sp. PhB191]|uniref:DUF3515 family protein n=1 Tax=Curtobacterium sp. PhB191 TaxID=2485202 RepID=UPI00104B0451|nr:DUF3515 family protein [Curtobacterium sp. PhB191]TCU84919.1 uncharacterized protein DUF3515 [Curtobacterium sp. PhB191]